MILAAIERGWMGSPDRHFGEYLMGRLDPQYVAWHPLCTAWDARLVELLAEAWPHVDLSDALGTTKAAEPWAHVDHAATLKAIADVWSSLLDFRLGQTVHLAFRHANPDLGPHQLFNLPDGRLLHAQRDLTEAERDYVDGEPAAARRGWSEWERGRIASHADSADRSPRSPDLP